MSIFSSILNKIFPHDHPANSGSGAAVAPAAPASATPASAPVASPAPPTPSTTTAQSSQPAVTPLPTVDVEAVLTKMQQSSGEQLNWRTSIVDLLKLLAVDSSLAARKELASELHYTGNTDDSATMNVWLHKQVMQKLTENGGKVPDELKN
jgi:3-oxoacyl-ACP reductase-like protein